MFSVISEHGLSCSEHGDRDALGVAEHALSRLTSKNWRGVANEIMSVEFATNQELSKLAYMVKLFLQAVTLLSPVILHITAPAKSLVFLMQCLSYATVCLSVL